jgi:hypothetical protein
MEASRRFDMTAAPRVFVLAGNRSQFRSYVDETRDRKALAVVDRHSIAGFDVRRDRLVLYGTYLERHDYEELLAMWKSMGGSVPVEFKKPDLSKRATVTCYVDGDLMQLYRGNPADFFSLQLAPFLEHLNDETRKAGQTISSYRVRIEAIPRGERPLFG